MVVKELTWDVKPNYEFPYVAFVNDQEWKIQPNDFPIEEKYSLFIEGQLKVEFSFWPEKYWGEEPEKKWNLLMDKVEKIK